ncbi:GerMN domain-containing protein [Paenibacillus sediminis]
MKVRNRIAGGLIIIPLLLSACSPGSQQSKQIDPPPPGVESQMMQEAGNGTDADISMDRVKRTTVYLRSDEGYLAPITLKLPLDEDNQIAKKALETLVIDGPYSKLLPEGFSGVFPKGTEVKGISTKKDDKLAIVEFNKAFTNYKKSDERKILEALTYTLTSYSDIEKVQIWVDGQKLNEMPVDGTPLTRPLTRAMGINLEVKQGVNFTQTSPVTVYFSAATSGGIQYYVPVTRLVQSGSDKVTAAIEELIHGPDDQYKLNQVMTSGTSLDFVKEENGTVTVALNDDMFDKGDKIPAEMLQSVVLTVTENSSSQKVQIEFNGQTNIVGTDDAKYSKPVSRPELINEIPL